MVWVVWLCLRRAKEQARPIRFENFWIVQSLSNQIGRQIRIRIESRSFAGPKTTQYQLAGIISAMTDGPTLRPVSQSVFLSSVYVVTIFTIFSDLCQTNDNSYTSVHIIHKYIYIIRRFSEHANVVTPGVVQWLACWLWSMGGWLSTDR